MDIYNAAETAYKNGYEKGSKEAAEKCKNIIKTICKEHNCLALAAVLKSALMKEFGVNLSEEV